MDTSAELGADVIGLPAGTGLGLEVGQAVGTICEAEDQIEGAGHVALEAVGLDFRADGRDALPKRVADQRVDPVGIGRVVIRSRTDRGRPGTRRVPAVVDEVFQRLVDGVAPRFPGVLGGHDLAHLLWGLGHLGDDLGDADGEAVGRQAIGEAVRPGCAVPC